MADVKSTRERWYCTLRDGAEENRKDYWSLKKANEEAIGEFEHQDEAVKKFKSLNLDATLWFQKGGKYVRTIKTLKSENPAEVIVVDSNDDAETKKANEKKFKEAQKARLANTSKKPATKKSTNEAVKVEKSKPTDVTFEAKSLPVNLFGLEELHAQAVFDTIMSDRASRRFSTHKVKNRGEVSGTGKKPWRQKGTGRARTGSLRTPVFVGGGRAFGPTTNKNYSLKVNKKVRALAVKSALSQLAKAKHVLVHEFTLENPSTKEFAKQLKDNNLDSLKHVLVVTSNLNVFLSARNMQNVETVKVTSLQVEALIAADVLVISSEDLKALERLVK
ncbi:50S ribosomal protein L4 [Mycoplasma phocoenae]|uniref:Large ribosomal subunit protein uL4 n=1 Tax=Mycoplasma phocoenae TaxID=754517 RepID=A0A858U8W4_9MOLU|nr:50S ribosomal protein L4 [Mycoplasma phocoenae]QJG67146.1 50S ribosomal protein L4 [Mycoplasma phocoenae]